MTQWLGATPSFFYFTFSIVFLKKWINLKNVYINETLLEIGRLYREYTDMHTGILCYLLISSYEPVHVIYLAKNSNSS